MKHIILAVLLLFVFTGCEQKNEDQKAHDAKVAQQAREQLLAELKAKEAAEKKAAQQRTAEEAKKKSILVQAGIEKTADGKIIIDTNKTKSYFEKLAQKMKSKMDKLAADMQRGVVEEKEAGIEVTQEKIVIDVNKTKGFMGKWAKKLEMFVKEMDDVTRSIKTDVNGSGVK